MYKKLMLIVFVITIMFSSCGERIKMKRSVVPNPPKIEVDTTILRANIKKALMFVEMNRIVGEISDEADRNGLFDDPEFGVSFYRTVFKVFDYVNTGASCNGMFEINSRPELVTLIRGGMSITASNIIFLEINKRDYDRYIGKLSTDSLENSITVLSNRIDYACDSSGIVRSMVVNLPDSSQFEYMADGEVYLSFMMSMVRSYIASEEEYKQVYLRKFGE